ncbi:SPFH domain-containing protein [Luteibacter sahnii]|uniref:SPFH domain-containing protein n=1 Tax=Luteibacter sahnii TaxID=3021977 RepID=UPI002A6A11AB|nr:SPFH domain-containing protein [Luteibacter sp. PPL193]MDY1547582.1 SPFH domain-containing protein [Luteibacter sp. PPL193]
MTSPRASVLADTLTWSFRLLFALVALLAGAWLVRGVQRVPPENRAVVLRFGQVVRTVGPGLLLTWPSPIESVVLLPSQGRQVQFAPEALERQSPLDQGMQNAPGQASAVSDNARDNTWFFLTGDGGLVHLRTMLFYQIDDPVAYVVAGDHIEPMLRRALITAALHLCASRSLDGILVARPEAAGTPDRVAQRERFARELVREVNRRLRDAPGAGTGIEVARIDVVPSIPAGAKESFDTVLAVGQQVERSLADARTTAETRRQIAEQGRQGALDDARARAEEMVRTAQARSALILSLGRDPSLDRATVVDQVYRERVKSLFDIVGRVETVPVDTHARTFISGATP